MKEFYEKVGGLTCFGAACYGLYKFVTALMDLDKTKNNIADVNQDLKNTRSNLQNQISNLEAKIRKMEAKQE